MFSINIYLRFALIALFLVGGVIMAFVYSFWWALPLILIGIVLLVGYFLFGTIQSSYALYQSTQNPEVAEKQLRLTYFPQWLFTYNRSAYYMLLGSIAMQRKEYDDAMPHFVAAQKIGFMSDNERGMALLQIAGIHLQRQQWGQAQHLIKQCKDLNITEPMLKDQVQQIDKALSQRGQMPKPGQHMGMMGGGKRPRPRVR